MKFILKKLGARWMTKTSTGKLKFILMGSLFATILNLIIPDIVPFVDEIILIGITAKLGKEYSMRKKELNQ